MQCDAESEDERVRILNKTCSFSVHLGACRILKNVHNMGIIYRTYSCPVLCLQSGGLPG